MDGRHVAAEARDQSGVVGGMVEFEAGLASEEWLLRVCSRLEEDVATRREPADGGRKRNAWRG